MLQVYCQSRTFNLLREFQAGQGDFNQRTQSLSNDAGLPPPSVHSYIRAECTAIKKKWNWSKWTKFQTNFKL